MTYLLIGYNTDARYPNDIRWREYTRSKRVADQFAKIPKIQFTDSGHGIVFVAREHKGGKLPVIRGVTDWVFSKRPRVAAVEDQEKLIEKQRAIYKKAGEAVEVLGVKLEKLKASLGSQQTGLF